MAGLVVGDDLLLVVVDHAARLHAGDDALERAVEVLGQDDVAAARGRRRSPPRCRCWRGRRRSGRSSGARRARGPRPRRAACSRVCTSRISTRPFRSGGATKIWRSKRPGRSSAGSSFSSRFEAAITTTSSAPPKPSISTSSWLSVWSFSPEMSLPRVAPTASSSSMKMIAGRRLARLAEQAPDARRAEAGEHLDERGRRLREELRARLVRRRPSRAASCRCRAGRAAGCPCGTFAPSFLKRFGSRRNSTTSRSSSLASSTPATSSQRTELDESGLISCGFVRGMNCDHPDQDDRDQAHEDERQPGQGEALDAAPEGAALIRVATASVSSASTRKRVAAVLARDDPRGRVELPALRQARRPARAGRGGARRARRVAVELGGVEHRQLVRARRSKLTSPSCCLLRDLERDGACRRAAVAATPMRRRARDASTSETSRGSVRRVLLIQYPNRLSAASS